MDDEGFVQHSRGVVGIIVCAKKDEFEYASMKRVIRGARSDCGRRRTVKDTDVIPFDNRSSTCIASVLKQLECKFDSPPAASHRLG